MSLVPWIMVAEPSFIEMGEHCPVRGTNTALGAAWASGSFLVDI